MNPHEPARKQDHPLKETGDLLDPSIGARRGEKGDGPEGAPQHEPPLDPGDEALPPENQRPTQAAGEDFS